MFASRTARSRNLGENLALDVVGIFIVAPVSQIKAPPRSSGRFKIREKERSKSLYLGHLKWDK
jgi:hypothetical protein